MTNIKHSTPPLLTLHQVSFRYAHTAQQTEERSADAFRLRLANFSVQPGETVAITGPSGSGKTTLLHLIAGILLPEQGDILLADTALNRQSERSRRQFRASRIGMVFQSFELIEYLSVLDNILLPLRLAAGSRPTRQLRSRAMILARATGIEHKLQRRPAQLSQGEQQRVAVCRALICSPPLILADEPTGNLDPASKQRVVDLLLQQCAQIGTAVLMVTHDHSLIARFDRHHSIDDLLHSAASMAMDGRDGKA